MGLKKFRMKCLSKGTYGTGIYIGPHFSKHPGPPDEMSNSTISLEETKVAQKLAIMA